MRNKHHLQNILSFLGLTIMIRQDVKSILDSPNKAELELLAIMILSDVRDYNETDPEVLEGYKTIRENKKIVEDVFESTKGIL